MSVRTKIKAMLNSSPVRLKVLSRYIIPVSGLCILLFFVLMEIRLYRRVQNYTIRPLIDNEEEKEYPCSSDCDLDALCTVTVKGMMLDFPNYYILGPLAGMIEHLLGLSASSWITPNGISVSHVFVAMASAKLISTKSLRKRRIGVLLFFVRSWMDDLDGFVARKKRNITGEYSEVGTIGHAVDAICDTLGTLMLLVGIFQFLRNNSPKHGYEKLQTILPTNAKNLPGACVVYKKKLRRRNVAGTVILIAGSLVVSSLTWNRFLYVYHEILETDYRKSFLPSIEHLYTRQNDVFRFHTFWLVSVLWRLTNPHALTDYLLIAVFIDRLWDYVDQARWIIYIAIVCLSYLTEFFYYQALFHITGASLAYPDDKSFNSIFSLNNTSHL